MINLILNYMFYNIFGFIGPAIATFISILLVQLFQLIVTSISINVKFRYLFPWKEVGIITLINVIMGAFFAYFKAVLSIEIYIGEILNLYF